MRSRICLARAPTEIVEGDLADIDACDAVLAAFIDEAVKGLGRALAAPSPK
jgi:hypothetical protein